MKKYVHRGILGLLLLAIVAVGCQRAQHKSSMRQEFSFVQMCDPQFGMGGYQEDMERFTQAVKQINELKPDFVVICGDLVNKADKTSFADFNTLKSKLAVPCYCAPGN